MAAKMLGRPVSVYGTVVRGRGRGKGLGFPTANLNPHHETLPPGGVYAARGYFNSSSLKGVIHIGARPTFGDKDKALEVHFLDTHKNLYGKDIELVFLKRLRGTRRFKNPKALQKAIQKDIQLSRMTSGTFKPHSSRVFTSRVSPSIPLYKPLFAKYNCLRP